MEDVLENFIDQRCCLEETKVHSTLVLPKGRKYYISDKKLINPAMSVDFYQLATCAVFLIDNKEDEIATFNMLYRRNPFGGSYAIFLGLDKVIEYLTQLQFTGEDIDFLKGAYKMPSILWEYLREFSFTGTLEAIPDGTMIQPHLPLIQVTAPLPLGTFIETALLTMTGYDSLVCTKAARIDSQSDKPWMEFGLRGAPGVEAGLRASRAAYIGGRNCTSTSNVLAYQHYGIPATGTMSHALVLAYPTEYEAFKSHARLFGEESVFLIDTYHYIEGTKQAIRAAKDVELSTFKGVRNDSSDLIDQSHVIRKILNDNGFHDIKIIVSSELDEYARLDMDSCSTIDLQGIGRRVVTMPDSGFIYKLVQTSGESRARYVMKLTGDPSKSTDPCAKKAYRFIRDGVYVGDAVCCIDEPAPSLEEIPDAEFFSLLQTYIQDGVCTYKYPSVQSLKHRVAAEIDHLPPTMLQLLNPSQYPLYQSVKLQEIRDVFLMAH